jgi:hypothetical protein
MQGTDMMVIVRYFDPQAQDILQNRLQNTANEFGYAKNIYILR